MTEENIKYFPLVSRSKTAALKQPKEITCFSRTIEGSYALDDSALSYYYLPDNDVGQGNIDLVGGVNNFKQFDEIRDGEFDGLLASIEQYERELNEGQKLNVDIITWRGIMTKILTLPYNDRKEDQELDLKLVKFDNQIFIQKNRALDLQRAKLLQLTSTGSNQSNRDHNQDPMMKKFIYSGYKFETIATLSKPWANSTRKEIESRQKKQVNNIEQYCSVVKTGIGKVRYCIGGEVDCCWDYKPSIEEYKNSGDDPLSHYVELKTTSVIAKPNQALKIENKLFKTWAQCFLIGIRKIVYGFRDPNFVLRSVEEFKTEEIPILIKNSPANTTATNAITKPKNKFMDSLKFLNAVLEFIVENVKEDNTVWTLSYNPHQNKEYLKLTQIVDEQAVSKQFAINDTEQGQGQGQGSDYDIVLTNQFKKWRKQNGNK